MLFCRCDDRGMLDDMGFLYTTRLTESNFIPESVVRDLIECAPPHILVKIANLLTIYWYDLRELLSVSIY